MLVYPWFTFFKEERMEEVAGLPVDELKNAGLTSTDIESIRELSALYRQAIIATGRPVTAWEPEIIRGALFLAYEQGLAAGIAKARGLVNLKPKIGF
jgi:hypothetical protein